YTHRSGRTARAGKKGISLAIVSKREVGRIQQIERNLKRRFTKINIPTGDEVCQKKLLDFVHRLRTVEVNEEEIDGFLPEVFHELADFSKEEIVKRFASIEFNRFLEYYRDAPDLNKADRTRTFEDGGYDRGAVSTTSDRVFINVGKMDGLDPGSLLGLICDFGEVNKAQVGKIDLKGAYSFVEIDKAFTQKVMQGFDGVEVRGRKVRLELTGAPRERGEGSSNSGERGERKERAWGGKKPSGGGGYGAGSRGGRSGSSGGGRSRDGGREKRRY
ncbi:MAG: DbpA RNA binding domain-containing protein, partial [Bacteroidia bacterium]|nr:DbpA RNA binding domain-containing protein [Bacteroidia bacterium]